MSSRCSSRIFITYIVIAALALLFIMATPTVATSEDDFQTKSSYSLRDYNLMTPVLKQQSSNCWAYAVISAVESNAIRNGLGSSSDVKFSELQLIWTIYNRTGITSKGNTLEELSGLEGDEVHPLIENQIWLIGSDLLGPAFHLMTGIGVVNESDMPDDWKNPATNGTHTFPSTPLPIEYAVNHTSYQITDFYTVSSDDRETVKEYLTKYGAGVVGYNAGEQKPVVVLKETLSPSFANGTTSSITLACFQNRFGYYDHLAAIAGWNDAFPRTVFPEETRPANDGAWLIKGSWGSDYGDEGYYWISYDDPSITDIVFFNGTKKPVNEPYIRNVYQYDGSIGEGPVQSFMDLSIRNNFTAACNETLTAVSIYTPMAQSYRLAVLIADNETMNQTGFFPHPGYYTIALNEPVALNASDAFAILVNLTTQGGVGYLSCDTGKIGMGYLATTESLPGQGIISWYDTVCREYQSCDLKSKENPLLSYSGLNFRIKAVTMRENEEYVAPVSADEGLQMHLKNIYEVAASVKDAYPEVRR